MEEIRDKVREWVSKFDHIPAGVVEKLMERGLESGDPEVTEVTPICVWDTVYSYKLGEELTVTGVGKDVSVELQNGSEIHLRADEVELVRYESLPMWGTLWAFSDPSDIEWLPDHLREMADCGFRIYEQEDYGLIFGIDGAGYDFYEAHWIPLFKHRFERAISLKG